MSGDYAFRVPDEKGFRLLIRVSPRSSRSGVEGVREGRLLVAVHAPPDKGAANKEVLKVLAKSLAVPRSSLEIVSGEKSRNKEVRVTGEMPQGDVAAALGWSSGA